MPLAIPSRTGPSTGSCGWEPRLLPPAKRTIPTQGPLYVSLRGRTTVCTARNAGLSPVDPGAVPGYPACETDQDINRLPLAIK